MIPPPLSLSISICANLCTLVFVLVYLCVVGKIQSKYLFLYIFSDLTYNIYLSLDIRVWGGVEYLTFDILLYAKFEQKVIGN